MIVRIATEGQYELGEDSGAALHELDSQVVTACEASDEDAFRGAFGRLLDLVRTEGKLLSDDELVGSDVILPPPDTSLAEAASEFTGEGLIPT